MTTRKTETQKQIERFENLIRVMRSLTKHERRKHFDMNRWGVKTECGTVMCAAGHCMMDPWFKRRGFKAKFLWDDCGSMVPAYKRLVGWTAVNQFFFGSSRLEFDAAGCDPADLVFGTPQTVGDVIRAAKRRIKLLQHER